MFTSPTVSLLFSLIIWSGAALAQSADRIVYKNCMSQARDELKQLCNARASADVGDPAAKAECFNSQESAWMAERAKKCEDQSAGAMSDAADPVAGATTAVAACIPSATRRCPPSTAPLPAPRPRNLDSARTSPATTAPTRQQPAARTQPSETDSSNRQAVNSARQTNPQPAELAGGDASSDVQLCESSYGNANRCCGNPMSCTGDLTQSEQVQIAQVNQLLNQPVPTNASGLNDYCRQMQQLGGTGGNANQALASVCTNRQQSCSLVCSQLAQKYLTLMNTCGNCDSYGIYQNTYQQLLGRQNSCQALSARAQQIGRQTLQSSYGGNGAEVCATASNASPQNFSTGSTPTPSTSSAGLTGGSTNPNDPYGCQSNPNSLACKGQPSSLKDATGTAAFETKAAEVATTKKGKYQFDVPGLDQVFTERVLDAPNPQAANGQVKTVPNNSGGGIPGAGGGSPASLGGSARGAGSPAASGGYPTDILQGTQGGSGYSSPAGGGSGFDSDGFDRHSALNAPAGLNGGRALAQNDEGGMRGVDLKQFLPGGMRDPQARLAGLGRRSEINAKEEDIWRIITTKIEEKCKLGILYGCR